MKTLTFTLWSLTGLYLTTRSTCLAFRPDLLASSILCLKNYNKTNKSLVLRYKNYYLATEPNGLLLKTKSKGNMISHSSELQIWVQSWEERKNGSHLLHSLSSLYPDTTCCKQAKLCHLLFQFEVIGAWLGRAAICPLNNHSFDGNLC